MPTLSPNRGVVAVDMIVAVVTDWYCPEHELKQGQPYADLGCDLLHFLLQWPHVLRVITLGQL